MSEKKQNTESETRRPVQTFRDGAVGGSVWLKQSNTGYWYYDFSLSRSWKSMNTGKDGYSNNFFERNRDELHQTIDECCDYIEAMIADAETVTVEPHMEEEETLRAA